MKALTIIDTPMARCGGGVPELGHPARARAIWASARVSSPSPSISAISVKRARAALALARSAEVHLRRRWC